MKQKRIGAASAAVLTAVAAVSSFPGIVSSGAMLLSAEFETTNDSFSGRGGASVQWTSDEAYTGTCSLFISERGAAWQGAQRDAASLMKAGQTYSLSAAVMQRSGEDTEMKFSLQYTGTDGKTAYDQIALDTAASGEWIVLSNTAYTVPEGATDLVIYLETTESETDFYVDTVTVNGAPSVIKPGDANGNIAVNEDDCSFLMQFLTTQNPEVEIGADMNDDGHIDAKDLSLLKNRLLFPPANPIVGDWDNYQETASPAMLKVYQDGVMRVGNTARIREKIAMAQRGENVTIGYIGGSITEGGSSTSEAKRYVNQSAEYFKETFGQGNNIRFVNAGAAGTSSVVGNMRVDADLFSKNCDIIFIEFAVNDQGDDRFKKSYEALVKKCLMQPNAPAVVLITLCQKSGSSNQDWMAKVGENYDLPIISGKNAVMNGISAGTLNWDRDYGSGDTIHPGDGGHKLIADIIAYYYRQALRSENMSEDYTIPSKEVFGAEYATNKIVDPATLPGFDAGSWKRGTNLPSYSSGYTYTKSGNNPLKFTTEGKGILLMFQSNSSGMGAVNVTVNGKTTKVSSNLQWTWGGRDGNVAYYQPQSGKLDVSISSADGGTFVIYAVAVIE
ncbi:MAG: carbohydrate binding domain-containing protein [Oscillospiraceae bacterium]|nr:carbohydrate binding domain-containing protein [Oscillospiraceae bacterium]